MLQHAKRQGSPWKSPGAKSNSPWVSQLPGHDFRLLEPEEHSWETSDSLRLSSSAQPADGNSLVEVQAAPKEADQAENVPPMTDRSDSSSSWVSREKKSTATRAGRGMGLQGFAESHREGSNRARASRRKDNDKV